jgi:peptidoglycan/LPS O-acetylase OafA/YrhL
MAITVLKKQLGNLHILRGLSALYVVVYHAKFFFWSGGTAFLEEFPVTDLSFWEKFIFIIDMMSSAGKEMVFVFFLLSGFFISLSLEISKYKKWQFLIIRTIRIYMPFVLSMIIAFICLYVSFHINKDVFIENSNYQLNNDLFEAHNSLNIMSFLKTLFFVRDANNFIGYNNVYWSLCYEMIFYFLIVFCYTIKRKLIFVILTFIVFLLPYFTAIELKLGSVYFPYFIYFGLGVLIQVLVGKFEQQLLDKKVSKWISISLLLISFLAIIASVKLNLAYLYIHLLTIIFSLTTMYLLLIEEIKMNWLSRFMYYLGEISYSLYLGHMPFFVLMYSTASMVSGDVIWYTRWRYWVFSILAIFFTLIIYYLAEKPSVKIIIGIKRKFK